jgi:hypothetical protein
LIKEFKGKNHLFQDTKTGYGRYGEIEQTITPDVLDYE